MKKKKYDRPFVEVLTLETSGGMMDNTSVVKGDKGNPPKVNSMKRPGPNSATWDDDMEDATEMCNTGYFDYKMSI